MKLLQNLITSLSSDDCSLSGVLLKVKVLLHNIGDPKIKAWIDSELKGYDKEDTLPEYRLLPSQPFAYISNGYHYKERQALPTSHLSSDLEKSFILQNVANSINVLESLLKSEGNTLTKTYGPEYYGLFDDQLGHNWSVGGLWIETSKDLMKDVLFQVKSRLLDFLLDMSSQVSGDEIQESEHPQISELFRNTVLGGKGDMENKTTIGDNNTIIIGSDNKTDISINVTKNDFESLKKELLKHNVLTEDLESLKSAIDSDGQELSVEQGVGSNVSSWIGNMVSKAASKVWDIELTLAAGVLDKSIRNYYGM